MVFCQIPTISPSNPGVGESVGDAIDRYIKDTTLHTVVLSEKVSIYMYVLASFTCQAID